MLVTKMACFRARWLLALGSASLVTASITGCSSSVAVSGAGGSITAQSGGSGSLAGSGGISASGGRSASGGASSGGRASGGGPGSGGAGSGGLASAGGMSGDGGGASGGAASTCPTVQPLTGGKEYCSDSKGSAGNGYSYERWAEGPGTSCMTVHGVAATFSAEWNGVEDFLARAGLDFNQTQTHQQIGTVSAEFAETKTEKDGGLTYIGIYGWTVSPLREFYILDDWGSEKPAGIASDGTPRDFVGTLTADGETYDVWKRTRVDKPAITGPSETFDQYFSIRRTARQCGTISVSEHFLAWEELGLPLGKFHEIKLLLEAQNNSGTVAFTTATVTAKK
jgi:endo-1,4-beta-xylanase